MSVAGWLGVAAVVAVLVLSAAPAGFLFRQWDRLVVWWNAEDIAAVAKQARLDGLSIETLEQFIATGERYLLILRGIGASEKAIEIARQVNAEYSEEIERRSPGWAAAERANCLRRAGILK